MHYFAQTYDLLKLTYAAIICLLTSTSVVVLAEHVGRLRGGPKRPWLAYTTLIGGFGYWATHYVAMLASRMAHAASFRLDMTVSSLALAFAILYPSFVTIKSSNSPLRRFAGGGLAGCAVAAMHYIGMAGFDTGRLVAWNYSWVGVSLCLGFCLGGLAGLKLGRTENLKSRLLVGAFLSAMTLAVHFAGMQAYSLGALCGDAPYSGWQLRSEWIEPMLVAAALLIAGITFFVLDLHRRDLALQDEMLHMKGLADATIEALIICEGGFITAVNRNLLSLVEAIESDLVGSSITAVLTLSSAEQLELDAGKRVEMEIVTREGLAIPVEVGRQSVLFEGRDQYAYALLDIRDRKEAEREIRQLANYDPLTTLPNRSRFYAFLSEEMERASRLGASMGLICIDLDNFKEVNDLHGHKVGDEFLRRAADVMNSVLDAGEILGRVGGDEFALIIPDVGIASNAGALAQKILDAFEEDNHRVGKSVHLSASLGISVFPADAASKADLLTAADTAMYRAKAEGRNTFRFFDTGMAAAMKDRRNLENDLRYAADRKEFSLVYQPQADCQTNQILGMEALLRWHHPVRGFVPPDQFIPIAENCGEICRIGDWVLENACRDAAQWESSLSVAVNVSAVQITNQRFAQRLHEILLQSGLPPKRLEIEITETALIRDFQRALNTLRRIKALGVSITMDDFGTGYSSLYNLRSFPFDKIKIDRSFIASVQSDPQSGAIVKAVIGLAKGLGLPVLAEGVETVDERDFLRMVGCNEIQGFLIGKPARNEGKSTNSEAA